MVRLRRLRGLPGQTVLVALAATLSAAVAGCATAPSGGAPRQAPGANSQVQAYVQPLPPPGPTSHWTPQQVVLGFLHASASYAFDPAAARKFLAPSLRKRWHPGRGPVVVVGDEPTVTSKLFSPKLIGPTSDRIVTATGQPLARLSQSGQYENASGQTVQYQFALHQQSNGVWLIQQFLDANDRPQQQQTLILTESDFEDVYQPRNLFFFASGAGSQPGGELVPDPVYAPIQSSNSALNTDLATGLVNGLLNQPSGWLDGVTTTAFPSGTRLLEKVTIAGKTAQVDLGGAPVHTLLGRLMPMAQQLAATLGDPSGYSQQLASSVQLSVDHKLRWTESVSDLAGPNVIPAVPSGPVQMITGTSAVGQWHPGAKLLPRLGPAQIDSATITALAASPAPDHPLQLGVAVKHSGGCAVYEQPTGQAAYKPYPLTTSGGSCTSLSYDADGNLWAAAGQRVWVFQPNSAPEVVNLANLSGVIQPGSKILAVRMAPDAVRAALLVRTPAGNRLLLSAVHLAGGTAWLGQPVPVGTGLPDEPLAVSWYDAYHLAALTGTGIYDVPLTTGAGQLTAPPLLSVAPPGAQTLTTDHTHLVVGTVVGKTKAVFVETLAAPPPERTKLLNVLDPVFPG